MNDVPAPRLLATLTPYTRADGRNDAERTSQLGVTGTDTIEWFDVFHGLVFGAPAGGPHRVTLRRVSGEAARLELPAIGLADCRARMIRRNCAGADPVWDWMVRPDGVAVPTMAS